MYKSWLSKKRGSSVKQALLYKLLLKRIWTYYNSWLCNTFIGKQSKTHV